MVTPEHSRPTLSDIPWPTTVTPDDMAKIDAWRSQGKPLEVSIAHVIEEESIELRDSLMHMMTFPPLTPEEQEDEEAIDQRFREGTSVFVGIRITTTHYAFAAHQLLEACGEERPRPPRQEEGIVDAMLSGIERDYATSKELSMEEVEQVEATYMVEGLMFEGMIRGEFQRRTPLEFIDFCTEAGEQNLKRLPDQQDPSRHIFREALRRGNQRFHQLYDAIQQELPQTTIDPNTTS